jgi:hypothetical protein
MDPIIDEIFVFNLKGQPYTPHEITVPFFFYKNVYKNKLNTKIEKKCLEMSVHKI